MRTLILVLTLFFAGISLASPPANIASRELTKSSSLDEILDALDARGQGLKSFTANVRLTEETLDFGATTTKSGKVIYQDLGDGNARIRVSFDTSENNGKVKQERLDYELIDGKLIERNYATRSQTTQQIIRPGEKIDLFKLGQGPFPLPMGQPKEEVYKQFEVKKIEKADPDNPDPANTIHIQLTPKPDTKLAQKLKTIDAWVETKSHMPVRIATRDHNETMDRTTDLSDVKINPNVSDQDFDLGKLPDANWNVTEQPFAE